MPLRTDRAATINPPDVRLNIDQNIAWRKRRVRHNELLNASPWCHPGPRTANASRSAQPPPAEHTACTPRDTSDPKCIREKPPLGVPLGATGDSQACAPPSEWGWGHRLRLYTSHYVSRGQTTVQPLFAFYASRLIYVDRRVRPSAAEPAVQVACGPLSHHGRCQGAQPCHPAEWPSSDSDTHHGTCTLANRSQAQARTHMPWAALLLILAVQAKFHYQGVPCSRAEVDVLWLP